MRKKELHLTKKGKFSTKTGHQCCYTLLFQECTNTVDKNYSPREIIKHDHMKKII